MSSLDKEAKCNMSKDKAQYTGIENGPDKVNSSEPKQNSVNDLSSAGKGDKTKGFKKG